MNPDTAPTPDEILDLLLALLSAVPGLTVVGGIPYKVTTLPLAYALCEGARYEASAQILATHHRYLVRVLVPWMDAWETSERLLNPFLHSIPRLLLGTDALGDVFVDGTTLAVDSSERGDGVMTIYDKAYRTAAIRFEVTTT